MTEVWLPPQVTTAHSSHIGIINGREFKSTKVDLPLVA
jgi:hypothetical protein